MKAERNLASSIFMPLLFAIINFIWVEGQLKSIVGYKLSGFSISARELLGILAFGFVLDFGAFCSGVVGIVCSGFGINSVLGYLVSVAIASGGY